MRYFELSHFILQFCTQSNDSFNWGFIFTLEYRVDDKIMMIELPIVMKPERVDRTGTRTLDV